MAEVPQSKHLKVLNYASVCECMNEPVFFIRQANVTHLPSVFYKTLKASRIILFFPLTNIHSSTEFFLDEQLLSYECKV